MAGIVVGLTSGTSLSEAFWCFFLASDHRRSFAPLPPSFPLFHPNKIASLPPLPVPSRGSTHTTRHISTHSPSPSSPIPPSSPTSTNPARHIVVYASRLRFSHCLTSRTDVTGETATRATTHVRPLRTISQCPVPRERHRRSTTRSSRPILSTRSWMALSSCISVRTPWHGPLRLRLCSSRTDSSQTGTWSTK